MTALEIVQAAYPGIPIAILNQFADLLPAEASALNQEFAFNDTQFYQRYINQVNAQSKKIINFFWNPEANNLAQTFLILNPNNAIYKNTINDLQPWPIEVILGQTSGTANRSITVTFDRRLYDRPYYEISNNIVSYFRPVYIFASAQNQITVTMILPVRKFIGIESINAAMQNGITFEINADRVNEFSTYISAYKKFATQIDAEKNLLEQQARNTVNTYKQQLDDQTAREYADLQAKKIQLLIAIDNDAKSAQRDFQNMLLTAQGLKNQIGGNLG